MLLDFGLQLQGVDEFDTRALLAALSAGTAPVAAAPAAAAAAAPAAAAAAAAPPPSGPPPPTTRPPPVVAYGEGGGSDGRGTQRGVGWLGPISEVLGSNSLVVQAFARMRAMVEELLLPYLPAGSRITSEKVSVMCAGHMHSPVSACLAPQLPPRPRLPHAAASRHARRGPRRPSTPLRCRPAPPRSTRTASPRTR
jgi:hypothetical protein